jgi:hypothetical protein
VGREAVILARHCSSSVRPQREAARKDLPRMAVWRSVILVDERQKIKFFQRLFDGCICCVCLQLACMWACIEGVRDSSAFIQASLSVLHEALCKFL